jgi:4-hydroxy-3-polyprenylbenzoate decarboxylase
MTKPAALPVVFALTGASGAPYAIRLLRALVDLKRETWLVVSAHGFRLLKTESDVGDLDELRLAVGAAGFDGYVKVFDDGDRGAAPASGSVLTAGMVICPCSMGTIASIAAGTSRSLVERAADVTLKERRKLVVVPRESPLSAIHLENMLRLTRAGGVVLPASPGFYNKPQGADELVDFIAARVLDQLGVTHELGKRWA